MPISAARTSYSPRVHFGPVGSRREGFGLVAPGRKRGGRPPRDARRKAIAETNAFLSWALARERGLPRIPRRAVSRGGFGKLLDRPLARTVVTHWWGRALEKLGQGPH